MVENDRIADPLDRAAAETDSMLQSALAYRKPSGPIANGECHNCGAPVDDDHRWCGPACRDDWEKDQVRAANAERE